MEGDRAVDDAGRWLVQLVQAVGECGPPAAGLAGQAQDLPAPQGEGCVLDGVDAVTDLVDDVQVADTQHRFLQDRGTGRPLVLETGMQLRVRSEERRVGKGCRTGGWR